VVSARTIPSRTSTVVSQGFPWMARKLVPKLSVVLVLHS